MKNERFAFLDNVYKSSRFLFMCFAGAVLTLFLAFVMPFIPNSFWGDLEPLTRLFPAHWQLFFLFFTTGIVAWSMLKYLEPVSGRNDEIGDTRMMKKEVDDIVQRALDQKLEQFPLHNADRETLVSVLEERLRSEAIANMLPDMRRQLAMSYRTWEDQFESSTWRLNREMRELVRRGNLNLVMGSIATAVGLLFLGYAIFKTPDQVANKSILALYFLPRLSLALLIEVFAYFFLRLYKENIGDIKYFHNEVTNIESKSIALSVATESGDESVKAEVIKVLASTERNFLLNKGQSTVELEREKIENARTQGLAEQIARILRQDKRD